MPECTSRPRAGRTAALTRAGARRSFSLQLERYAAGPQADRSFLKNGTERSEMEGMPPAARENPILALGAPGGELARLAERARELRFTIVRAKSPLAGVEQARERGYRFRAVMIEASAPDADLRSAVAQLRTHHADGPLSVVAIGRAQGDADRDALRELGAERILAEPLGDNELRFELNRALFEVNFTPLRAHLRAPTEWLARVFQAGREKRASVYSVSSGGAFLRTSRPSMKGAQLAIELPLPGGAASVAGRVIYTNVPGNVSRRTLPHGMAVHFTEADSETRHAIDRRVTEWLEHTAL